MSNDISKKIRNVRAKEGMTVEEFAEFIGVEPSVIANAEEFGVIQISLAERMNEVCPEHLFFVLAESFENENKKYEANSAFRRKWANKNSFKINLSLDEKVLKQEFEKYLDQVEQDYKKSFGFKISKIMDVEKLSFEKLNQLTGTSESTLKKYSGNHVTPGLDFVQLLCSIYPEYTMYLMFDEIPASAGADQITPEEKTLRDLSTSEKTA